jgi:indole-3-acetaldehyde oxidase
MAAKQAVIEYSTKSLQPPILTIEDSIQRNNYFQTPPSLAPKPVGNYNQGMSEADHKILSAEVLRHVQKGLYSYLSSETNTHT